MPAITASSSIVVSGTQSCAEEKEGGLSLTTFKGCHLSSSDGGILLLLIKASQSSCLAALCSKLLRPPDRPISSLG
ncbi:hypothetical protein CDAR_499981 [Caerostris darwini]|uniref:Uncharacterized protein n=1 Tax=Caerostris darwini TaxID=1538125 RepID=A0AAV4MXG3_9ARAC|nr:hypothetical protein CDAR_499981 [Caerostris darwini]